MKYLKKFNELFDSEELKSQFEISNIQGKLLPNIKGDLTQSKIQTTYNKLVYYIPWIELLDINGTDNGTNLFILTAKENTEVFSFLKYGFGDMVNRMNNYKTISSN